MRIAPRVEPEGAWFDMLKKAAADLTTLGQILRKTHYECRTSGEEHPEEALETLSRMSDQLSAAALELHRCMAWFRYNGAFVAEQVDAILQNALPEPEQRDS